MSETQTRTCVKLTITDTMSFWNNQVESYIFYREMATTHQLTYDVPTSWIVGGTLTDVALERVLCHRYGETWRDGNADGSKYMVLEAWSAVAAAGEGEAVRLD